MKNLILFTGFFLLSTYATGQNDDKKMNSDHIGRFLIGIDLGISGSYSDAAHNISAPVSSICLDYHIGKNYYLQIAPRYSWLFRWNEHYLTLPLHVRKRFNKLLSVYEGPSITRDVGYFRDLGISVGINFHISERSSINLSVFTFSLADYHIHYRYVPVGISFKYYLLKK